MGIPCNRVTVTCEIGSFRMSGVLLTVQPQTADGMDNLSCETLT